MKIYNKTINKYLAAILFTSVLATACEKRLDVFPYQSIADNKALLSEGDVNVTLIGAYDGAQAATVYGGDIMVLNEVIGNGENINFTGTFAGLSDAFKAQMVANNGNALGTWTSSYNTINRINNVLTALDKVTSSASRKSSVEGEALFLRGSIYFELVKLFAKSVGDGDYATNPGVPLVLTPTGNVSEADYKARATVKAVYDQVIADLTRAESLLCKSLISFSTLIIALLVPEIFLVPPEPTPN